ncbi:unnamed protein product [Calypogeia fissa]
MKEIVTVQVGTYANFVGSHFWNFQDETLGLAEQGYEDPMIPTTGQNLDVLFRVGETRQGRSTYTPRLLSLDFRGSSGAVSASGSLYDRPASADLSSITTWNGPAATFRSERQEKNKFLQSLDDEEEEWFNPSGSSKQSGRGDDQDDEKERALVQSLEEGVQYWTDYSKTHLHPSSTYQIPGVWQGVTPFDNYGCGKEVISGEDEAEELRDKVRFLVEECDHMQGFQFLVDDLGGFSCVAADVLDDIVEEYGKTPISLYTVRPPDDGPSFNGTLTRRLHDAVSLARLAPLATVTIPLGLTSIAQSAFAENLLIQDGKLFHSSAVYAAAINNITLPYRMEVSGPLGTSQGSGLGGTDIGTSLRLISCSSARRVALLEAAFPAPGVPDAQSERGYNLQKLSSLTPNTGTDFDTNQVAEMLVVQGARLTGSGGPATTSQVHDSLVRSSERLARAGTNPRRGMVLSHLAISPCPLAIPLPFPCIFSPFVGKHGDILSKPVVSTNRGRGGIDVVCTPVTTRVSTSGAIVPYIVKRWEDMQRLGLGRATAGPRLLEDWGFAREEVQELGENLSGMRDAYKSGNGTDSSDGE